MARRLLLAVVLLLVLTGCTEEGYPTTDTEVWAMATVFIVLILTIGAVFWKWING